ncbi:MAG: DUF2905 domain-containing protein [Candidatus Omnitrophica bacterium]|nr:DUF2905 domain-containing protein [Candidatus Omnitrophota bacterium]MCK5288435.1 DUF2905 domain-containing protein [Candidatus Omnitrophota bacterium]
MRELGKIIIFLGITITIIGFILFVFPKIKLPFLGRLPGDILVHKKNFSFYFPITTCIILSIILSIIGYFILKK